MFKKEKKRVIGSGYWLNPIINKTLSQVLQLNPKCECQNVTQCISIKIFALFLFVHGVFFIFVRCNSMQPLYDHEDTSVI